MMTKRIKALANAAMAFSTGPFTTLNLELGDVPPPPPPPPVQRGSPDPLGRAARLRGFVEATDTMMVDALEQTFSRCQCGNEGTRHGL